MQATNRKELAQEWINRCKQDFKSAKFEFAETGNYTLTCFLCQQIIERYFKACLMIYKKDYPKSHNLIRLLNLVGEINKDVFDYKEECDYLNSFYVDTRYPAFWGQSTFKRTAKQALEYTESTIKYIKKLIAPKLK